jgi:hypothetical protein
MMLAILSLLCNLYNNKPNFLISGYFTSIFLLTIQKLSSKMGILLVIYTYLCLYQIMNKLNILQSYNNRKNKVGET